MKFKEVVREARRLKSAEKYKDGRNKKMHGKVKQTIKKYDLEDYNG